MAQKIMKTRIYHRTWRIGYDNYDQKICVLLGNNIVRTIELRAWVDGTTVDVNIYDMYFYVLFELVFDNVVLFKDKCTKVLINGYDVLEDWWGV